MSNGRLVLLNGSVMPTPRALALARSLAREHQHTALLFVLFAVVSRKPVDPTTTTNIGRSESLGYNRGEPLSGQ